jgi:hypothetical protein
MTRTCGARVQASRLRSQLKSLFDFADGGEEGEGGAANE